MSNRHCTTMSVALLALGVGPLGAQDPTVGGPETAAPPTGAEVKFEDVEAQRKAIADSELTDAEKERAAGLLMEAETHLKTQQTALADLRRHDMERLAAPQRVDELKRERDARREAKGPPKGTVAELEQELALRKQSLKDAETERDKWGNAPATRTKRREEIEKGLGGLKGELPTVESDLASPPTAEAPEVFRSWRLSRKARKQAILTQVKAYETELAKFAETIEQMRLEAEVAPLRVERLTAEVANLQSALEKQRSAELAKRGREAERAFENAHESTSSLAKRNLELYQRLTRRSGELAVLVKKTEDEIAAVRSRQQSLAERHASLEEKLASPGMAAALGPDLIRERLELPHAGDQRHEIRRRNAHIGRILKQTSADDRERDQLQHDVDRAVLSFLEDADVPERDLERVRGEVRTLYEQRLTDLTALLNDYEKYLQALERLNFAQADLVATTERYAAFLEARSRWVRSAGPLEPDDLGRTWAGLVWLSDSAKWVQVATDLRHAIEARPFLTVLVLMSVVMLAGLRERLRRRIGALGKMAGKSYTAPYSLTVQSLACTIAVAAVWPLLVVFVGWKLWASVESADFSRAVGVGLVTTGIVFATLEFTRQLFRPAGLADAHFHWKRERIKRARTHLRWLALFGMPSMFVVGLVEWDRDVERWTTLGRLSLIVELLLFAAFAWVVFRPVIVKREGVITSNGTRGERLLHAFTAGVPFLFALLTAAGYQYTTWRLGLQMLRTVWLVLAVAVGQGMIVRWLYYSRGRLAIEQIRKRKEAEVAAGTAVNPVDAADPTTTANAAIAPPPEPEIDLATVNAHTRQLLKTCVSLTILVGFWLLWFDEIPAVGGLDTTVWSNTVQVTKLVGETGNETAVTTTELRPVRVSDLLFALVVLVVSFSIARNVPSLLEVLILQYLPMDAGARYAASMLARYLLIVVGVAAAFGLIGVSGTTLSWFVGVIGFGLAFGLQEVFANFVCGLILLFERPIRVGDIVTVGDVTGIATQVQIRATTIRDWDRKEYIVPNKELVTGRLLNWTLSDKVNRVVITIGVAYGSDTDRARELLFAILRDDPEVLDEPPPMVTFEGFGDSTLNMVVRAYLPSLDNRLETIHRLHTTIHRRFAEADLEIAFPQRDIHVRSLQMPTELARETPTSRWTAEADDDGRTDDRSDVA